MKPNKFLYLPEPIDDPDSDWVVTPTKLRLNTEMVEKLRRGPLFDTDDTQAAVELARLVHDEYAGFGTSGPDHFDNAESAAALKGLKAVLKRLGIESEIPFRDFNGFYGFWSKNGMSGGGGWAARRGCLADIFEPIHSKLEELEDAQFASELAEPIAGEVRSSWVNVDDELRELRRRYHSASTAQDYRDVGNRCVGVLEALSATIYDPTIHLREGESEPEVSKTKQRIGRYIETKLAGGDNEALRGLVGKVSDVAHSVKHSSVAGERSASIAADTVIMLVGIIRRLEN